MWLCRNTLVLLLVVPQCTSALVNIDCSEDTTGLMVSVSEIDPPGIPIAVVNNTKGTVEWTTAINGTSVPYLHSFFRSQPEVETPSVMVLLERALDLELLTFELVDLLKSSLDSSGSLGLELSILCTDWSGRTWIHDVSVNVNPANEFYPQFNGAPYHVTISEDKSVGTELISLGGLVTDMDAGTTTFTFAASRYMITQFDGSRYVRVTSDGHVIWILPVDFEAFPTGRNYVFINVTVQDDGGLTSSTSINVTVMDVNDQGVEFIYPNCSRPCMEASYSTYVPEVFTGELVLEPVPLRVVDLDTLGDAVVYRLVNEDDGAYFQIDQRSGQILKTSALINDSYGPVMVLQVRAEEATDSSHFLVANITIVFLDRLTTPGYRCEPSGMHFARGQVSFCATDILMVGVVNSVIKRYSKRCYIRYNSIQV
ncbi:cadherin-99C-like isoform X2 [Dreissena polymorpha]|uniref:cadherin-99C-like isoform X2 n=1 Tax=Dreissena polymorpha TaxID=45954 RepID=UPI00226510E3|nr:cadherin-99C-like isoform X2 [Dreissena polymorpha]